MILNVIFQRFSIAILCHHETLTLILPVPQSFHHVSTIQHYKCIFLHFEKILSDLIINRFQLYHFYRHNTLVSKVLPLINTTCCSLPQDFIQLNDKISSKVNFGNAFHGIIQKWKSIQNHIIAIVEPLPLKQISKHFMSRPENQLPPDLFYNITEASKYESNTRIQSIQRQIAERAIQLLNLPQGSFILDIGCGSGLSAQTLEENGFIWEGFDISRDMLHIASSKQQINGGLWQMDIGQGWKVRPGVFDGAISISTIQWLCVASRKSENPFKRCCKFFQSLYDSLRIGARAVLQFYPDGKHQLQMITTAAMKSGFTGGLVVDYPNSTKAKKYYLVIEAGVRRNLNIVEVTGRTEENENKVDEVKLNRVGKNKLIKKRGKKMIKQKQEVVKRKERLRRKGIATKKDTKYTGRRRKPKF